MKSYSSMLKKSVLIVGSSSGLGRALFDLYSSNGDNVTGLSRYKNGSVLDEHQLKGDIHKYDLLKNNKQKDFDHIVMNMSFFTHCIFCVGGGYGIKSMMPSFDDLFLLLNNLLVPAALVRSLFDMKKINNVTKICFISSIAAEEVTASVGYTTAKLALNGYSKLLSKYDNKLGPVMTVKLGAVEGYGAAFDRLKVNNKPAYEAFIHERLNGSFPMHATNVAEAIVSLLDLPYNLVNGLTIKLDNSESSKV